MKRLSTYILAVCSLFASSCSDFLDTTPKDAMSPVTTWKTESDVESFLVGCYNKLLDGNSLLYLDCGSDIGYNNFPWEGYRPWGDGSLSTGNTGASFYSFTTIRRCNTVLENIDKVTFSDAAKKDDLIAQAKAIRAYCYFCMNWYYGGVPIIGSYTSAEEAQVPKNTEAEVRKQIADDLEVAITSISATPSARGRFAKGTAFAIKMREALYYGDWDKAKTAAQGIIDLRQYDLEANYTDLFKLSGRDSKEIILAAQYLKGVSPLGTIGQMYNNADAGWSSIVPTQNLIDMYEMSNGLTKEEAGSQYDEKHPFANRDPRMAMTVLYPGRNWRGSVINTLDETINGEKNKNYPQFTDNASKTALTWAKYLDPMDQYGDIWDTEACIIVFRYAEVLLSWAEAANELSGPSTEVYDKIDLVRKRVGMPVVDRNKYNTKETLRELIRRERCVEFAGEGLRRADIVRWKDNSGKMIAETVLNGPLNRIIGTVKATEADPTKRAEVTGVEKIEDRKFAKRNRYLPIPQGSLDANSKLTPTEGY